MSSALLNYLQEQPGMVFKRLYRQPSTVLAVLRRMLPHLAKIIVMAMLYMPDPFTEDDLFAWIRKDARKERDEAIAVLRSLHIMTVVPEPVTPRAYALSHNFATSLRFALTGGGDHNSFGVPVEPPKSEKVDIAMLDNHARAQWEAILFYMVGSSGMGGAATTQVTNSIRILLERGTFVAFRGSQVQITEAGFTFLLQEANVQVWKMLIVYLNTCEERNMQTVEVLAFLFMLGSLELGQAYSTQSLTETQKQLLEDLSDFGLVYRNATVYENASRCPYFYPTRLATTLTSDAGALPNSSDPDTTGLNPSNENDKGYIILETNHRLYAYTSSLLQINILQLFAVLKSRFPNLVAGKLTKESIQRAISLGITSDQIISYLTTHAHPQMRRSTPVLPPTVMDQIRLWQQEGDRMKATSGFLFKDMRDPAEYRDLKRYAETIGVLVWHDDQKRMFFVSRLEQLQAFIKDRLAGRREPA